jgi:hypothetical protein
MGSFICSGRVVLDASIAITLGSVPLASIACYITRRLALH